VVVDAVFLNADGGFITSAFAMIDSNPILPGQTAAFSVMETFDPDIRSSSVSFKTLSGKSIRTHRR
jgi:hypothetical protein